MQGDVIKLLTFSLDGEGFVGDGFFKEPDITAKTESDENSYVALEQVVGMNALTATMTLTKFAPTVLAKLGICSGNRKRFIGRGSFDDEYCNKIPYRVVIEGLITEIPGAELKVGRFQNREFKIGSVNYYQLLIGGKEIWLIDRENNMVRVNGVDQMAEHRRNVGLR